MLAARLGGGFATLQVRLFLHHVGVKIVLSLCKACPVALCALQIVGFLV